MPCSIFILTDHPLLSDEQQYDQALLPLCLGNDLFSKLVEMRGPQTVHDLQLSMRYSHLASTFGSLDMTEEACLSLVLAVVYEIVASIVSTHADQEEDEPIRLFRKLSILTNGVVLMDYAPESRASRRSLVSRLVQISESLTQQTWSLPACSAGEDFVLLTRRLLRTSAGFQSEEPPNESEKTTQFSLATLMSFALKDNNLLRTLKKTQADAVWKEQLLLMADVVAEQGASLQDEPPVCKRDPTLNSAQMKEFNRSFQFFEWLAKNKFQDDEDSRHASLALVHILAAVSLVPSGATGWPQASRKRTDSQVHESSSKPKGDSASLLHARMLVARTTEILTEALDQMRNKEQRLLSSALLVCAALYSSEISGANPAVISAANKSIILSSGNEAAQLLVEIDGIGDEARDSLRMCLTRTLTRFQDMVNLEGDKLSAAQSAMIIARIHQEAEDEKWYWAMAGTLLFDAGLQSIAQDVLGQNHLQNQLITFENEIHLKDLIQLEMIATQLRMEMHSLDADSFKSTMRKAEDLFGQCSAILVQSQMEPFTRIVLRWMCSSCVMTLAEGFECRGEPNRAVDCLRQGVNLCRESISSLRKLRNVSALVYDGDASTAWPDIALSTIILRFTERRIAGQKRISTAYARLGDHRRSEAYAVGAAKECLLGGQEMTRQRLKIHELASIDRRKLHVMCQSSGYRLLLEMKAKASPSDRVLESLHSGMVFDGILRPTHDGRVADRVAWQIENIWDLVNGESLRYISHCWCCIFDISHASVSCPPKSR